MPVTDISYNYITVSFNAPVGSPPIGYYGTAVPTTTYNKQITIITPQQSTNSPIKFSGLVSGTIYSLNITSIYSIGNVTSGNTIVSTASAPPTGLSITNPTVNSLTVGFVKSLGSIPIGYYATALPVETDNGQTTVITTQTTSTLINISNLVSGTLYNVYVSSVYDTGDVSSNISQGITIANPPTNLIITDISYSNLSVRYSISVGSTSLGYYATAVAVNSGLTITSNTSYSNPLIISGLISGTTYNVTVTSIYSHNSVTSNFITVITPSKPPQIIGITDSSYNSLTVSFVEPFGNSPNSYFATAAPLQINNNQQTIVSNSVNSITPIQITGLISGTTYTISVSAVFNNQIATSNTINGNTTAIYPTNLSVTNPTLYSLTVGYTQPISSPPIGYYAIATPLRIDNGQTIVNTSITTSTLIVINSLISGTIYNISVSAVYNTGNVISFSTVNGTTVSFPPSGLSITDTSLNSISILYTAPSGNIPIGYYATAFPLPNQSYNGQRIITTRNTPTSKLFLTIPGLVSGTNYTIYCYSIYSNGDLSSNSVITGTTAYPPSNLQFVVATPYSITIGFTPPLGSLPEGYTITSTQGGSGTALQTDTSITMNGLSPNTIYSGITITAIYSSGNSTATLATQQKTIGMPASNLLVIDTSVNFITLSYTPYSSYLPDYYTITSDQGGSGTSTQSSASITISGLTPNTSYTNIAITSVYLTRGNVISTTNINYYTLGYNITNLKATPNLNSIDLSFTSPLQLIPPNGYYIRAIPATTDNEQPSSTIYPIGSPMNSNPITIPGLISGTSYTLYILTNYNSLFNSGNVTSNPIQSYTLSNQPTITGVNINNDASINAITVYFNRPLGSLPLNYRVTAKPRQTDNFQDYKNYSFSRGATSYQIGNLISGTNYDISMSATYDICSNSTGYVITGNTLSTSPTFTSLNFGASDASTNAITVYFNPPLGSLPLNYKVTASPRQTDNEQTVIPYTISRGATSYQIEGLKSGTTYDISMASVYDISINVTITPSILTGNTLSNAPTLVSLNSLSSDVSSNAMTVYFNAPVGSLPIKYFVTATPRQSIIPKDTQTYEISRGSTSYQIGNLVSATTYDVSMSAIYNISINVTKSPSFLTSNTLSYPPTMTSLNSGASDASTNSITVYFNAPVGSLPINYLVSAVPRQTTNTQTVKTYTIPNQFISYQIKDLVSGTTYDISMAAVYDTFNNVTNNPSILTGNTLSFPPTMSSLNSGASDVSTNSITVYFNPPLGNSLPKSYSVTANPRQSDNFQIFKTYPISRGATSYQITGLTPGTTYDVSMAAIYDLCINLATSPSILTTNTSTNPPVMTSLNYYSTDNSTNAITVYFNTPVGGNPLNYTITATPRQTGNGQIIKPYNILRTLTSYQMGNLVSGTTYDITMNAIYNTATSTTTSPATLTGNTTTNPPVITGINKIGSDASSNSITVYYQNPVGSLPLSYLATITPQTKYNSQTIATKADIALINKIGDISFVVSGLFSGTAYDVSMAAIYDISINRTTIIYSGTTLSYSPSITSISNNNTNNTLSIVYSPPTIGTAPIGYYVTAVPSETQNGQSTITFPLNPSVTTFTNSNPIVLTTSVVSGTNYTVTLNAIYDVTIKASTTVQGNSYSSPPSGLNITNTTSNSFTVSYNQPSGVTTPKYYYATAVPSIGSTVTTQTTASTSLNITGLTAFTNYTINIFAGFNSTQASALNSYASINRTTYGLPPTLFSFDSGNTTATSIAIKYTPPTTTPSYYTITATASTTYYGQPSVVSTSSASPTYVINNLFPGTNYTIALSATYSTNTASATPSSTVSGYTSSNAATQLAINNIGTTQFDVSFAIPTFSITNTGQQFNVVATPVSPQRSQGVVTTTNYPVSSLGFYGIPVTGLIPGTNYSVGVFSIYDTGNVGSSSLSTSTLLFTPTISLTSDISYNYLSFVVSSGSVYSVINYSISYNNSVSPSYITTTTQTGTSFKITGLNAGSSYNFRANTAYEAGTSSSLDISGNTTALPVKITNVNANFTSLTVTYTVPTANPTQSLPNSYYAVAIPDGTTSILGQQTITSSTVASSSSSIQINGLTSGTLYNNISVYSVFPNTTVQSISSSAQTLASAPTITSIGLSATTITVNYNPPLLVSTGPVGGVGITYYARVVNQSNSQSTDTSGNPTSFNSITITNLFSGTSYNVYVHACYSYTSAGASFQAIATYILNPVTTSVSVPTNVYNASPLTTTSILVAFTAPAGSSPTGYIVYAYSSNDTVYSSPVSSNTGSTSPILLSNLTGGTTYQIRVVATFTSTQSISDIYYLYTHL